jgi:hypothetical protein
MPEQPKTPDSGKPELPSLRETFARELAWIERHEWPIYLVCQVTALGLAIYLGFFVEAYGSAAAMAALVAFVAMRRLWLGAKSRRNPS